MTDKKVSSNKKTNKSIKSNNKVMIKKTISTPHNSNDILLQRSNSILREKEYPQQQVRTVKKKIVVKRKLNIKNIIIFILILIIILLIPIYFLILNNDNDKTNSNNNITNKDDKQNIENLDEFDKIGKELSFYKNEYKERYISYKEKNPSMDLETVIVHVNIGIDQDFYTNIISSPRQNTDQVLVNKYNFLAEDYTPQNLETISSQYSSGNKQLESNARIAFEQMAHDAKLEGYTIRAVSTYRSYTYQKNLYTRYANADGTDVADTYSARAGHSEHQTGLAVDVDNATISYTNFGNTKEFIWMQENAYKYGYILRYTKDNEFITGYKDEPWHYRYVGVEIATYIQNNPMTYEEYYVRFLAN